MSTNSNDTGGQSGHTTAPVAASAASTYSQPEYIRLPKSGPCPITGLTRSRLYDLISPSEGNGFKPPVKSVSLRKPGQIKSLQNIKINKNMTSSNKGSDGSADKSDNPLPSVNELSPYTKAEFEILKLAVQGHSLKATAALLGLSEDQVAP